MFSLNGRFLTKEFFRTIWKKGMFLLNKQFYYNIIQLENERIKMEDFSENKQIQIFIERRKKRTRPSLLV